MPTDKEPLVSVLMAYYDNTQYVEEAIVSVLNQSYGNIELIAVDDCSPSEDGKRYIVDLSHKYGFTLISHAHNMGAAKAFRTAFENSSGEYISIISHDDIYSSDKIEFSMRLLRERDLDVLYCNGSTFNDDDLKGARPFNDSEVLAAQEVGQSKVAELISSMDTIGCLLTQGALYRRCVWEEQKIFRDRFLLDDWPFTIIVWRKYRTLYESHNVYYYRLHEDNVHKNYFKWLPARIQTVCELVDGNKKTDVMANILIDVGAAAMCQEDYKTAFALVSGGLMMAESEKNILFAQTLLARMSKRHTVANLGRKLRILFSFQTRFARVTDFFVRLKRRARRHLKFGRLTIRDIHVCEKL